MLKVTYELHTKGKNDLIFKKIRILGLMSENKLSSQVSLYNKYQRVINYIMDMIDNYFIGLSYQLSRMGY